MNRRRVIREDASELELWLLRYSDAVADEALCVERLAQLETYAKATTRRITGLPGAKGEGNLLPELGDERSKLEQRVRDGLRVRGEISAALGLLPPDLRRLMEAYYIDGKSWESAAEAVPCHVNTVAGLRKKALTLLRQAGYNGSKEVKL